MDKLLIDKAMALPPNERIAFAELILESIDYEDEEVRRAWIDEVKNRIESVDKGHSRLMDFKARYGED